MRKDNDDEDQASCRSRSALGSLGIGIGSAYADGGDGPRTNFYTVHPGVAAKAPVQNSSAVATVQNEQRVYVTRSDRGTWLFVPDPNVPTAKPETQSVKRRGGHPCRPFAFGGEWAGGSSPALSPSPRPQSPGTPGASFLSGRSGGTEIPQVCVLSDGQHIGLCELAAFGQQEAGVLLESPL